MDATVGICMLIGLVATALLIAAWIHQARPRWQARKQMDARMPLADEAFGRQFFPPEHAPTAALVRRLMAEAYHQDLSRLHPDDRLDQVLPLSQLDSLDTAELILQIERRLGIELPAESVATITTFRELMSAVQTPGPRCGA